MKPQSNTDFPRNLDAFVRYGAFELKRCYQRNLGLALFIAGTLHIAVICGFILYSDANSEITQEPEVEVIERRIDFQPPPISMTQTRQEPITVDEVLPISLGIAEPVPDDEAPDDATVASQQELDGLIRRDLESIIDEDSDDSIVFTFSPEEYLPERGEYVHHDQAPRQLNQVTYTYPPLALQAGIEGTVLIEALVDKDGNVRDAVVVKPSGCNAGFEEAALEGAYKIKYTPALSNNQPVAVRVTYPVRFKLK
jgi:protein TonB